jgi:hypothetical protein
VSTTAQPQPLRLLHTALPSLRRFSIGGTRQESLHGRVPLILPRQVKRSTRFCDRLFPHTGSTIASRWPYISRASGVAILAIICCDHVAWAGSTKTASWLPRLSAFCQHVARRGHAAQAAASASSRRSRLCPLVCRRAASLQPVSVGHTEPSGAVAWGQSSRVHGSGGHGWWRAWLAQRGSRGRQGGAGLDASRVSWTPVVRLAARG